ncbi:hypothetical protein OK016_30000 [Vibrio chagasii]|nr:hypothetical protein [Vibrio chagasii]
MQNRFGGLPYLFKVLAAESTVCSDPPKQAAKRNLAMLCLRAAKGIPMTAGNRNYRI